VRARAPLALVFGALALTTTGGCSKDFAPFNRLTSLRVLAVQSEPAAPFSGETGTLSALVFTPTDDPSLTYAWSWCPFPGASNNGYPCLVDEATLDAAATAFGVAPPPAYDLGTAPTAQLPNSLDPSVLAAACAGMLPGQPAKPDCTNGFPIQVKLTVTTATDQVITIATIDWRFDAAVPPNANPVISGLTATLGGVVQPITDPLTDPPGLTFPRDVATPIGALVTPDAAEVYAGLDDNGNPATLTERLFLTWFVESGDTDNQRTSFISGSTNFDDLLDNTWTPAATKDYPGATARLFVVIHDSRGGVGWQSGAVNLEGSP
jgi:hypothetical protein